MSDEKKIIIDEDWKSQVEAEKESRTDEAQAKPEAPAEFGQMPPASFEMLLTTFASEAMVALGQLPNPISQEIVVNIEVARYAIDMLAMLQEKTKGNLTPDEDKMLEDLVHQLRMLAVATQSPDAPSPGIVE